jgi:hypothetical protein
VHLATPNSPGGLLFGLTDREDVSSVCEIPETSVRVARLLDLQANLIVFEAPYNILC